MRIENLKIENFRAIEKVWIDTRSTMIVIAGPNGCGKSCVLDGIRFIKSAYGGYGPNEWDQWLGEFQINREQDPWEMRKILRDKTKNARIAITLALHPKERLYLQENDQELAEEIALNQIAPGIRADDQPNITAQFSPVTNVQLTVAANITSTGSPNRTLTPTSGA